MRERVSLTNVLLGTIAVLLALNLVANFQRPIVARAGGATSEERIADALQKIANDGLKVKPTGEYGYGPVEVKIKN